MPPNGELASRPLTSAVISFGGTLASAALAAGTSLMFDGEGRRRSLFEGSQQQGAGKAAGRGGSQAEMAPEAMDAEAVPVADLELDPRRISDMYDENGNRCVTNTSAQFDILLALLFLPRAQVQHVGTF